MESSTPTAPDMTQLALVQKMLILNNKAKGGANWFFWIAALSVLNSIIYLFGATITFVVGLGVTQFVDGFMGALAQDLSQSAGLIRVIGIVINLCIAGVFALFGVLGRKKKRGAIITGMVLYIVDAIIVLIFKDYFGAIFHALAIFGIWTGLTSLNQYLALEKSGSAPSVETLQQQIPSTFQSQTNPSQSNTRHLILGGIVVFLVVVIILVALKII